MKRFFIYSMLLSFIGLGILPNQSMGQSILPYPIYQKQMSNGLNVVTVPFESPGIAAFYIVVRVGSRDEIEKGKTGFAHFFEHMMFRGTDKYSKAQYSEALKSIGASANANTWLDRTVYHMTGNAKMLDKMFELESDRFMNLNYSIQDFKTEAGAVKGEYTKNFASYGRQLDEKMNDVAFTSHTYKHTTMGFFEDIVDMPNQYEYSMEFFKRFYKPEYCTILVVGDVKDTEVNALAEKYFGMWKRGSYVSPVPPEPAQTETRYAHIKAERYPPQLSMAFKGPAYSDNNVEMAAIDIMNSILFSERSALYKKYVVEEQKLRSLSGYAFNTRDPYLIQVEASFVNAADMQSIRNEITKAINELKTKPVDKRTLDEVKSNIKYSFAMGMDTPDAIANSLSYYIWVTGNPESLNKNYANYDKVTVNDIMNVANKFYNENSLTISTISPDENSAVK
ncbi:MAG TPA: pitrilysin family protein [Bacteroidia bacterium]|nr:pitrilysin family protein [Bacteroidia bacterium]